MKGGAGGYVHPRSRLGLGETYNGRQPTRARGGRQVGEQFEGRRHPVPPANRHADQGCDARSWRGGWGESDESPHMKIAVLRDEGRPREE